MECIIKYHHVSSCINYLPVFKLLKLIFYDITTTCNTAQFPVNRAGGTLLVVAFTPSNSFVAASSSDTVHTVSTTLALRARSAKREMKAATGWGDTAGGSSHESYVGYNGYNYSPSYFSG